MEMLGVLAGGPDITLGDGGKVVGKSHGKVLGVRVDDQGTMSAAMNGREKAAMGRGSAAKIASVAPVCH